jgi:hypothetical protein
MLIKRKQRMVLNENEKAYRQNMILSFRKQISTNKNYREGKRITGLISVNSRDKILFKLILILYSSFINY